MNYYIGLDIGGTKIAGALVSASGKILTRNKTSTPKKVKPKDIYICVTDAIDELIHAGRIGRTSIKGIGVGVPGIVDTLNNHILAAPNIALTGLSIKCFFKAQREIPLPCGWS